MLATQSACCSCSCISPLTCATLPSAKRSSKRTHSSVVSKALPGDEQQAPNQAFTTPELQNYTTWPAVSNPPTRRLLIGLLSGLGIAIGGNLGGVTGFLLGLDGGQLAQELKIDTIIPVLDVKRCISGEGFEFVYPASWLADQTVYRRQVEAAEAQTSLDFPDPAQAERVARRRGQTPTVAFGPMGGTGEDNISVISAPSPGLVLENFGTPQAVAQQLLDSALARPGSGKEGTLIMASSRVDEDGVTYYELEYLIRSVGSDSWVRHNLSVLAARNGRLYTLNAQCNASKWETFKDAFRKSADSFRVSKL